MPQPEQEENLPAGRQLGQADGLDAALQVIRQMEGTGLLEQVTKVDASKSYDLALWCEERLEIRLGGNEDLEYKIQYLQVILEDLEDYQTGTIDLTFDVERVARFIEKVASREEVADSEESDEPEPAPEE